MVLFVDRGAFSAGAGHRSAGNAAAAKTAKACGFGAAGSDCGQLPGDDHRQAGSDAGPARGGDLGTTTGRLASDAEPYRHRQCLLRRAPAALPGGVLRLLPTTPPAFRRRLAPPSRRPLPLLPPCRTVTSTSADAASGSALEAESGTPQTYGAADGPARIVLRATADSWIQVRDADRSVAIYRRAEARRDLSGARPGGLSMRAGNAGGLDVVVDGKPAPSLGPTGAVRNVALDPQVLTAGTRLTIETAEYRALPFVRRRNDL